MRLWKSKYLCKQKLKSSQNMQNQVWCFTFANRHLPSWHMYWWYMQTRRIRETLMAEVFLLLSSRFRSPHAPSGGAIRVDVWDVRARPSAKHPRSNFRALSHTRRKSFALAVSLNGDFFASGSCFITRGGTAAARASGPAATSELGCAWQWPWPSSALRPTSARRCVSLGCCYQSHGSAHSISKEMTLAPPRPCSSPTFISSCLGFILKNLKGHIPGLSKIWYGLVVQGSRDNRWPSISERITNTWLI